jgi:hypothetical protein
MEVELMAANIEAADIILDLYTLYPRCDLQPMFHFPPSELRADCEMEGLDPREIKEKALAVNGALNDALIARAQAEKDNKEADNTKEQEAHA